MTRKRILILDGHPARSSISHQLARTYFDAAKQNGHDARIVALHDLDFDPDYGFGGYKNQKPLEPDLESFLDSLEWCEHFVMTSPMWWGGLPAKLKGLIDRTFLPGRTFDPRGTGLPKPLLSGRSAHVILTSDSPWWYFRFLLNRPLYWQLKRQILGFVGFKPVKVMHFAQASHPKDKDVDAWMQKVSVMGTRAA
ncbi:NAD(P)H-dependent oxidoreductase [Aliisedimentitalea scapharcae]|uniref:NAD(P)H-dependent oxidoreductase n=1 Tax=Aliisedimentitalea scapharcae TaxID=1524259 RepID=A0ABZ2XTY4_9RHOB|nr:NAD(P)H-dependent oxidoreductase [Rhodobacteraceae bacterium M382]